MSKQNSEKFVYLVEKVNGATDRLLVRGAFIGATASGLVVPQLCYDMKVLPCGSCPILERCVIEADDASDCPVELMKVELGLDQPDGLTDNQVSTPADLDATAMQLAQFCLIAFDRGDCVVREIPGVDDHDGAGLAGLALDSKIEEILDKQEMEALLDEEPAPLPPDFDLDGFLRQTERDLSEAI